MSDLSHHTYDTNGIRTHTAEQGAGPPVILCHGFPELWYSWRHQLPAIAGAGFRAIAPDMRGYGETDAPPRIEDYTHEQICADMLGLLDAIGEQQAVFVGHDWGGAIVWAMALHYPERVRAVAGVNTPFAPAGPTSPAEARTANPGRWDYQLYFQDPGVAEAELEADVERTFRLTFRSSDPVDGFDVLAGSHDVRARGGWLAGYPADAPRSVMLTAEELDYFVQTFRRTGFRGGLNWYRNQEVNWRWARTIADPKIEPPALMVTAGKDPILTPDLASHMEQWIPQLSRGHIEQSAHWTQQEAPEALNRILVDWLGSLPPRK